MQKNTRRTFTQGFTLLEVIVVIGIIGLMATMIVPTTVGQVEKAKVKKTQSDLKAMKAALDIYAVEVGRGSYPKNPDEVVNAMKNQGITWNTCRDGWDQAYSYYRSDDFTGYCMVSAGSDGSLEDDEGDDIFVSEKQNPVVGSFDRAFYGVIICNSGNSN